MSVRGALPVVLLLALFSGEGLADASGDVEVEGAYVRAVPAGQTNTAAYMQLTNKGDREHRLVGAVSPVARVVELHDHFHDKGMMQMRRVDDISVPEKGEKRLAPGGLHIMLIDLRETPKAGSRVPLTLDWADGSRSELEAEVRHPAQDHHGH